MWHIKPFLFFSSSLFGLVITLHPGISKRTPRFWNGIAGGFTLSLLGSLLRLYITNSESFSCVCDEPVGKYVVGIYSPSPTYKAPSPSVNIRSVSSLSGIKSAIISDGLRFRLLSSLRLGTATRVAVRFCADQLFLRALTASPSASANCTTSR